uniref:Uncharacterized protein n=1 Tax=Romanomermis culicivorax TaxID=13658 RepID=A0A915LDF5_ROMCU
MEISAGILAYVYSDNMEIGLRENFRNSLQNYYALDDDVTKAVDSLHRKYGCCGAVDFKDWRHSAWYNKTNLGKIDHQLLQYNNSNL